MFFFFFAWKMAHKIFSRRFLSENCLQKFFSGIFARKVTKNFFFVVFARKIVRKIISSHILPKNCPVKFFSRILSKNLLTFLFFSLKKLLTKYFFAVFARKTAQNNYFFASLPKKLPRKRLFSRFASQTYSKNNLCLLSLSKKMFSFSSYLEKLPIEKLLSCSEPDFPIAISKILKNTKNLWRCRRAVLLLHFYKP